MSKHPVETVAEASAPEAEVVATEVVAAAADVAAVVAKEPRRKSFFNFEANQLEVTSPDGQVQIFDMSKLPATVNQFAVYLGVWTHIRATEDLAGNFAKLVAGDLPEKETKTEKLSPWKLAVAHALVHEAKEAGGVMTLEAACAYAKDLDRKMIEQARLNPTVVHYHNQLNSKPTPAGGGTLMSLVTKATAPAIAA